MGSRFSGRLQARRTARRGCATDRRDRMMMHESVRSRRAARTAARRAHHA
ncbi:hypothetical protein B1M_32422 [Burkholderia sp. TJI49]|nr:hypothetical protein B1M_32422 [Burkholderia sp. TJI49]